MPDISKCENQNCTLKESCYRYTSEPSLYQSYGFFEQDKEGNCNYYWKNKEVVESYDGTEYIGFDDEPSRIEFKMKKGVSMTHPNLPPLIA